jgi:hypothetical protein
MGVRAQKDFPQIAPALSIVALDEMQRLHRERPRKLASLPCALRLFQGTPGFLRRNPLGQRDVRAVGERLVEAQRPRTHRAVHFQQALTPARDLDVNHM